MVNRDIMPSFGILFLPHCLEEKLIEECKALGTKHGWEVKVVKGGREVFDFIAKLGPSRIIGVACKRELGPAIQELSKARTEHDALEIEIIDPCHQSRVDIARLERIIIALSQKNPV